MSVSISHLTPRHLLKHSSTTKLSTKLRYQATDSIAIKLISAQNSIVTASYRSIRPSAMTKKKANSNTPKRITLDPLSPRSQRPPGTRSGSQYNAEANNNANESNPKTPTELPNFNQSTQPDNARSIDAPEEQRCTHPLVPLLLQPAHQIRAAMCQMQDRRGWSTHSIYRVL